jgi:hypothetical protein
MSLRKQILYAFKKYEHCQLLHVINFLHPTHSHRTAIYVNETRFEPYITLLLYVATGSIIIDSAR